MRQTPCAPRPARRRTASLASAAALAAATLAGAARADPLDGARTAWQAAQYRTAAQLVSVLPRPERRTYEALYIQGTSACRVSEWRPNGLTILTALVGRKGLAPAGRDIIGRELQRCGQALAPQPFDTASAAPASMSINGKVYMWLDGKSAPTPRPVVVKALDEAVLAARKLPPGDAGAAAVARAQLPGCRVLQTGILTLCSASGQSDAQLRLIAGAIDRHVGWLTAAYGFSPPSHNVYVYLMPTVGDMRRFGANVHGLDLAYGTIGYALDKDASVAAVASGLNVGTVLHEITHLVMGQTYPDAPEWLEEGLASLYETSLSCGGVTLGDANWRGQVLQQPWAGAVSLEAAVRAPWYGFKASEPFDPETRKAAVFYSLSRYLMLHLQETGRLGELVREMQIAANADLDAAQGLDGADEATVDPGERGAQVLARITGEPLAATEAKVRRNATRQSLAAVPEWVNLAASRGGLAPCPRLADAMPIRKSVEMQD